MQARAGRQKSRSKEKRDIQLSWMSMIFIEASYLEIGGKPCITLGAIDSKVQG
jgi:hypothetical protein